METCVFEGCPRKRHTKIRGLCNAHDLQYRQGKELLPIGTSRKKTVDKTFSETKVCDTCKTEKSWKSFVMGTESKSVECRDCYRKRILPEPEEAVEVDLTPVLAFIEKMEKKAKKKRRNRTKTEPVGYNSNVS